MEDKWSDLSEVNRLVAGFLLLTDVDSDDSYSGTFAEVANNWTLQDDLVRRFSQDEIEYEIEKHAWSAEQAALVLDHVVSGPLATDYRPDLHRIFNAAHRLLVEVQAASEALKQQFIVAEARKSSSKAMLPPEFESPHTDLLGFAVNPPLSLVENGERLSFYPQDLMDDERLRAIVVRTDGLAVLLAETRRISSVLLKALELIGRCESNPVCLSDFFAKHYFAAMRQLVGRSNEKYDLLARQLVVTDAELRAQAQ